MISIHLKSGQIEVELQDAFGGDRQIAEAAWTSSTTLQGKNNRTEEDVARVVNMLADSGHSVPFESVIFRFWIKLPITADRQHITHRIGSHSGMSGRYRTMPSEYLAIPDDVNIILDKSGLKSTARYHYNSVCNQANTLYNELLKDLKNKEKAAVISNAEYKRCREFLRGMLPQNNMTERVSIFNLRSFANYVKLRNSPDAQKEIQMVANLMLEAVKQVNICPAAITALERNGWKI